MTKKQTDRTIYFYERGLQYYVSGRFAYFCYFSPIAAVLLHHAVELFLKATMVKCFDDDAFKKTFGHNLEKLWKELKKTSADASLDRYDQIIKDLGKWEELRYPIKVGHVMRFELKKRHVSTQKYRKPKGIHEYEFCLEEIDNLIKEMLSIIPVNSKYFRFAFNQECAREFYSRENNSLINFGYDA